ncbi:MAG: DUF6880 family protein [Roseiarcus sp.]|jgi:hypothetical protein
MARKAAINLDALTALGAGKLAKLVLDETERDAGFRKLVSAALAGTKGPEAVASLVDRRLGGLERARGFIEWDKAKTFAADLDMTIKTIVDELGPADAAAAVDRLIRFVATHRAVFERVDDSSGRVQNLYQDAIAAMRPLVGAMAEADRSQLPNKIASALANETHGYMADVVKAVVGDIPEAARASWDAGLAAQQVSLCDQRDAKRDWDRDTRLSGIVATRQAIAEARGDLDGFIALEETKQPHVQETMGIAERLLAAGRGEEALIWVRRKSGRRIGYISHADLADRAEIRDLRGGARVTLEARILEKLGDKAAARALLWAAFESTLDAEMLRQHVRTLDDFDEFDVLDRAFDHVSSATDVYRALVFFIAWPRLDRAARLVVDRRDKWDGRHYQLLAPATAALEPDHPAAAAILYRALLSDILARAKAQAYGHGARYLAKLDQLAGAFDAASIAGMDGHASYRAALTKAHGRKSAFWTQVHAKR